MLLVAQIAAFRSGGPSDIADFRQLYTAGYIARTNPAALYDLRLQQAAQNRLVSPKPQSFHLPFNHLAYEALGFLPLSYLPYHLAYVWMFLANLMLLPACYLIARPVLPSAVTSARASTAFLFFPVIATLFLGQDSILFLLLCCSAWRCIYTHRLVLAGFLVALCLFKPQITIPLAVLLAARLGRRFLVGFVLGAAAVSLLSVGLVHGSGIRDFLHVLHVTSAAGEAASPGWLGRGASPISLKGLLAAALTRHIPHSWATVIYVSVNLIAAVWAFIRVRSMGSEATAFAFSIICALLLSYVSHISDLTLLLLPCALLQWKPRSLAVVLIAFFVLPLALLFVAGRLYLLAFPLLTAAFVIAQSAPSKREHQNPNAIAI